MKIFSAPLVTDVFSNEDSGVAAASIMVVDDIPENLLVLSEILKEANYRVRALPNGAMALASIRKEAPDLILLDIMLPDISGYDVCMELKSDPFLKDIPIIFISALHDLENKINAFNFGGVDYITKPFHEREVLARVNTHVSLRQCQKDLRLCNLQLKKTIDAQLGRVMETEKEIAEAQLATIAALSKLAEARDDDTGHHIERTQAYCRILAEDFEMLEEHAPGLPEHFSLNMFHAAALHDIGKVSIPDSILLKPGPLTPEEFETMKKHTVLGAATLEKVQTEYQNNIFVRIGIEVSRSHHEKWDGSGYPDGLSGEDIPLSARIMALADYYDALTSKRCYKEAWSHELSMMDIVKEKGIRFSPAVTEAFLRHEQEFKEIRHRIGAV